MRAQCATLARCRGFWVYVHRTHRALRVRASRAKNSYGSNLSATCVCISVDSSLLYMTLYIDIPASCSPWRRARRSWSLRLQRRRLVRACTFAPDPASPTHRTRPPRSAASRRRAAGATRRPRRVRRAAWRAAAWQACEGKHGPSDPPPRAPTWPTPATWTAERARRSAWRPSRQKAVSVRIRYG